MCYFVFHHLARTAIYRPFSYPLRSIKNKSHRRFLQCIFNSIQLILGLKEILYHLVTEEGLAWHLYVKEFLESVQNTDLPCFNHYLVLYVDKIYYRHTFYIIKLNYIAHITRH